MIIEAVAFTSGFMVVFLKGIQSQNIIGGHYAASFFTSLLVAMAEAGMVTSYIAQGFYAALFIGSGGGLGAMLSIYSHRGVVALLKRRKTQ